jgi:ribosomal protein S18 acetylase RimI-like enzyme
VPRIEVATGPSEELLEAVRRLVPQLSASASAPKAGELEDVISSPATTLLLARDEDDRIVGMLTLALFRIPTGTRAWIEDVVVDEGARGMGAGEALTREAIALAEQAGARTVDLTSRPEREGASKMYEKIGFRPRRTNVYRYVLE